MSGASDHRAARLRQGRGDRRCRCCRHQLIALSQHPVHRTTDAVEVVAHQRRQGVAEWMMRAAAFWGTAEGATHLAVLCVTENTAANALYTKLGFAEAGRYHYRISQQKGHADDR